MRGRVAVLMGGCSAEREVSLVSGQACAGALRDRGYAVTAIDLGDDLGALLAALTPAPDAVFNALHGRFGEDGCVQGMLNLLRIPYTHSGLLASALAMDKPMAKAIFAAAGIPVAEHVVVRRASLSEREPMARPFVVKPINEGSSVGVRLVFAGDNRPAVTDDEGDPEAWVMVERFVPGRELTVAVMSERALAVTEIATDRGFYDYRAKYAPGGSRHLIPAPIPAAIDAAAKDLAVRAHTALGCRGVSRADFRYDGEGLFILEVNTQPGMTPTSLVPEQAAHVGIPFGELVAWMVENAEY
ncbi:MAG: D-alanine--D-alanine ligase, partial [Rhodospirillales bacterium]|nr:D-alanine--D-alanine ligase [Rhodospirillales bacterium]